MEKEQLIKLLESLPENTKIKMYDPDTNDYRELNQEDLNHESGILHIG